jgi:multicomponent Na+:H+ antiporter subunit B
MNGPFESNILQFLVRIVLVPVMLLFGIYVLVHGELSPGGGFQSGAIIATAIILARLSLDREQSQGLLSTRSAMDLVSFGALVALGVGLLPLLMGADFLDYGALPIPSDGDGRVFPHLTQRGLGILVFEAGIAVTVTAVIVTIFDALTETTDDR